MIFGYPAVWGEVLQHRHHKGQAAIPVAQQQHHSYQVDYTHHSTSQVISHVENLTESSMEEKHNTNLKNIEYLICAVLYDTMHSVLSFSLYFTSSHW